MVCVNITRKLFTMSSLDYSEQNIVFFLLPFCDYLFNSPPPLVDSTPFAFFVLHWATDVTWYLQY